MSASDEVGLSYGSSLEDLTFNSKPIINSLTMIAEELIDSAPSVVAVIEETLATRPADKKLPVMYLLDSICKNIGGAFVENFQVNLPETVGAMFEVSGPKVRNSLNALVKEGLF